MVEGEKRGIVQFEEDQISEIKLGKAAGVDTALYADTKYLAIDDTDIILELIKIAQSCRRYEIVSEFTDVIRKRIYQI